MRVKTFREMTLLIGKYQSPAAVLQMQDELLHPACSHTAVGWSFATATQGALFLFFATFTSTLALGKHINDVACIRIKRHD